jgi:hypothetical protein
MGKPRRKPRTSARRPSARRKTAPRRSRRRATPRIERKPLPPIRTKEITRWRKANKWVKAGTPGAVRYDYIAQVSAKGKILRTIGATTPHLVTKFIAPGTLDEPWEVTGDIAKSGNAQGFLRYHLQTTNVISTLARGAAMIEVTIKGRDTSEKIHRLKVLIQPETQRDLDKLLISRIITAMREAGVRTNYTLDMLKAAKSAGPLTRRLSYQKFRTLEPLHDMEVIVTVHR